MRGVREMDVTRRLLFTGVTGRAEKRKMRQPKRFTTILLHAKGEKMVDHTISHLNRDDK